MGEPTVEVLCKNCGQTFTAFLKEMAAKNAEVTCPHCGKSNGNSALAVRSRLRRGIRFRAICQLSVFCSVKPHPCDHGECSHRKDGN
jgi:hypothetical protein